VERKKQTLAVNLPGGIELRKIMSLECVRAEVLRREERIPETRTKIRNAQEKGRRAAKKNRPAGIVGETEKELGPKRGRDYIGDAEESR